MNGEPLMQDEPQQDVPPPVENQPTEESVEEIFGVKTYEPEQRKKLKFLPWHRPRKQYVRETQWCQQIRELIQEVFPDNNVLKYLGLPGDDLLDLRYFHEQICVPNNLKLKFLGFNKGLNSPKLRTDINISLDEVSRLQFVDQSSLLIPDDICDIANPASIAWTKSRTMGPFDVVNIDLCDGFGKHPTDEFIETHYNTIRRILALQSRRPNPWLLLLTTRTGTAHINAEVYTQLRNLYKTNLIECTEFRTLSTDLLAIGDADAVDAKSATEKGVSDIFLISLSKWIARLLCQQNPPAKLILKSAIGYKVLPQAGHLDLVSIAVKVEPTFAIGADGVGLANQHPEEPPNECEIAAQVVQGVFNQVDADGMLADDNNLLQEMIEVSTQLLQSARYETAGYNDWARGINHQITNTQAE